MQPVIINDAALKVGAAAAPPHWLTPLLRLAVLVSLLVLLAQPGRLEASTGSEPTANNFVQPARGAGRIVGLNQAIRIAQEESGGQVLSAKSVRRPNGALVHRVRVLVDGQRVMTMVVEQNGRLRRGP